MAESKWNEWMRVDVFRCKPTAETTFPLFGSPRLFSRATRQFFEECKCPRETKHFHSVKSRDEVYHPVSGHSRAGRRSRERNHA